MRLLLGVAVLALPACGSVEPLPKPIRPVGAGYSFTVPTAGTLLSLDWLEGLVSQPVPRSHRAKSCDFGTPSISVRVELSRDTAWGGSTSRDADGAALDRQPFNLARCER